MDKELIEKWKNNRIPNSFLTYDELTEMKSFGECNFQWRSHSEPRDWNDTCQLIPNDNHVYRLRPDYQPPKPEPKIVKYEITKMEYGLMYVPMVSCQDFVETALRRPSFLYYEKGNGNKIGIENIATEIRNGGKVYACFIKDNNE
jgi:hypothetical protein